MSLLQKNIALKLILLKLYVVVTLQLYFWRSCPSWWYILCRKDAHFSKDKTAVRIKSRPIFSSKLVTCWTPGGRDSKWKMTKCNIGKGGKKFRVFECHTFWMGPIIIFTTIRDIIANGVAKISLKIDRAMLLSHEPPYMLCASYVLVNMRMKTCNLVSGNDCVTL